MFKYMHSARWHYKRGNKADAAKQMGITFVAGLVGAVIGAVVGYYKENM